MKRAYSVALVALALLAALATGCSMPDYQLDFSNVDVSAVNGNVVTVYYQLTNQGTKGLKSVQAVFTAYSTANSVSASTTVSIGDISSGGSTWGNAYVYLPSSPQTPYSASDVVAYVTNVSWDAENSNSIF